MASMHLFAMPRVLRVYGERTMTDIRVKGFDSKRQFDQDLAEHDSAPADVGSTDPVDGREMRRSAETEIAWLRKEAAELRDRLLSIQGRTHEQPILRGGQYSWLAITVAACAAISLAGLVRRSRMS